MAMTEYATGANETVKVWSQSLAVEAMKKQYFLKFMGQGDNALIKIKKELTKGAGDRIRFTLRMKMTEDGIEGDNIIEGTSAEEALTTFTDDLYIDQRRKGTKSKGKMSEQRVQFNMRKQGRDALAEWWAEDYDEQIFMALSGHRGLDTSFHPGLVYTGRAQNTFLTPDSDHVVYGGDATGLSDIDTLDKIKISDVDKLVTKLETLDPMIQPFMINGEARYVLLMHNFQWYDLRTNISQVDWLEIHKAVDGQKSPIYKNSLGEHGGMILHKHRNVIRFSATYGGTSSGVTAARALCLGAQAGMIAWGRGSAHGRYSWNEETDDRGNALVMTAGAMYGTKKTRFNSKDFGVIAVDTYAVDPNA
ncbi:MAG: N4-gp56 family major capsid protein [Gammaproteobacteria bacterium]|nr:N4-gp56 family major capsid protein [Gammaproteobacteria bacterium]